MAVYGKLILEQYHYLDEFIDKSICDGDKDKIILCHKYISNKLKSLESVVKKQLQN